jgi:hypothetical protein
VPQGSTRLLAFSRSVHDEREVLADLRVERHRQYDTARLDQAPHRGPAAAEPGCQQFLDPDGRGEFEPWVARQVTSFGGWLFRGKAFGTGSRLFGNATMNGGRMGLLNAKTFIRIGWSAKSLKPLGIKGIQSVFRVGKRHVDLFRGPIAIKGKWWKWWR